MDVWGPAPIDGTDQERYFLLVVDDYTHFTTVFPLRCKADVSSVLIPWIHATRRQLRERFSRDFPVLHLHSDLLAEFCRDEGIVQSFTLPASPQQNGIAERHIGLIMEVAHTSMIHAAAPHILWSYAVRYAAHQPNLWPRVSEPDTSPTLWWMGKVGDASVFRVWGALSLVRDAKASKLSSRTLRCLFLGNPTDAPSWHFYHLSERRVFSSLDVTFDESVCYYTLHPHTSHPGPASSGVSQVDPPPLVEPLEVSSDSSGPAEGNDPAADDTAATRHSPLLETPPGFAPRPSSPPPQPGAVESGADTASAEPGGADTKGEGSWEGAGSWGASTGGVDPGVPASPSGIGAVGDPAGGLGAGQPPQPDLLETLSRTAGAGGTGGTAGAGGAAGAGGTRGAAGAGGTRGAAGAGVAEATCLRGPGAAGASGAAGAGGAGGAAGAAGAGGAGAAGTALRRPYFYPQPHSSLPPCDLVLRQVLGLLSSTSLPLPLLCPLHTFSPTPKMTTLRVLLHVAAQRDYELHSLDFSTAFLQGSLHEEIWLRRLPRFTGSFPAVYVNNLVFATTDTEALALVKAGLQERHTCTDLGELRSYLGLQITWDRARRTITLTQSHMVQHVLQRFGFQFSSRQPTPLSTSHSFLAPPSDKSVEPSGLYPELVGCLISNCEAKIYAWAMAAHELRWLTYLLTDLGERPRSSPVLYVGNKAMLALCHEQRMEHIALRYFLARELQ
ncbi:unnamed protein product [Closterium sp. NIES-54]